MVKLEEKLNEEVKEYQEDKSLGELADVLEVLYSLCSARGYTKAELEAAREKKAKNRGGFNNRIFLEYVDE
ncbi:nucleoside triphosphate pyrophosphohydrolase [Lacrimispora sp.]|jgi:predicted house-cleaning noncanonical NTP pyrophosphatase (MazG superfamily)|uniref:nucleoside triphosphate pyrophosphohydrolase n=1 Tax=Lacrimispora sp. TaxID=2719234 RepID=UPI00269B1CE6|nr:nucleoside triphosphate pyrophosphohydrolase [Lacrimispora sp.]